MLDLSNAKRTIVLPYDQRPWTFDLDKLETAYLVYLDTPESDEYEPGSRMAKLTRLSAVGNTLAEEHNFPRHERFTYAQAAEIYHREHMS